MLWGVSPTKRRERNRRARGDPPVSPDVGLVAHSSQRDPVELAAQRLGHGPPHTRLADPGGAHEAQDGAFQVVLELPHGQVLQHPLLQLLHGVVVVVQEDAGRADVQPVCRVTPRERLGTGDSSV